MKLKVIFIIFNILIVVSFALVFLLPAILLGWDYAGAFWSGNWYLALIFVVVIGGLNGYFVYNFRLFSALEREDWQGVIEVLERRVMRGSRRSNGQIRLLVNAYVVTSRPEGIERLEEFLRQSDRRALVANAVILGIPHLLSNDGARMERYYGEFRGAVGGEEGQWIEWCYGFALMLQTRVDEARTVLASLAEATRPGVLAGLNAYLLDSLANADESLRGLAERERCRIVETVPHARWKGLVERRRSDLYVLILTRLVRDAETWLYRQPSPGTEERSQ